MPLPANRSFGDQPALKVLYEALHRYAGWLDRERNSRIVRADVEALGTAIDTCADAMPHLQTLDADLARLPSGDLRTMLRKASAQIRHAIEAAER